MKVLSLALLCFSCVRWIACAEEQLEMPIRQIADATEKDVKELVAGATVSCDEDSLTVRWHTRDFKVYQRTRSGRWADELSSVNGPDYDGWRIVLRFASGAYKGALERNRTPILSPKATREPYFYTSYSLLNFGKAHATVDISFGEGADTATIEKVYRKLMAIAEKQISHPIVAQPDENRSK